MTTRQQKNEYDETKSFLQKIRKLNKLSPGQIKEQIENPKSSIEYKPNNMSMDILTNPKNWGNEEDEDDVESWKKSISKYWEDNPKEKENKDFIVINNVEVVINSTDSADFKVNDDEKGIISQLIDDFRTEVSDIVEFGKLNIYDDNAKLDGVLNEISLNFTLSAGDDNGLFLSNLSMIKVDDNVMANIDKLKKFQIKFNDTVGQIIANRQQN